MKLELYYKPTCSFCQRVLHYIDSKDIDGISLLNKTDPVIEQKLIKIGGKAQVPCLVIDDKPLYESSDIIDWLEQHLSG